MNYDEIVDQYVKTAAKLLSQPHAPWTERVREEEREEHDLTHCTLPIPIMVRDLSCCENPSRTPHPLKRRQ